MLYLQAPNSTDRSFQYGDGLFTTVRVKDGKAMLWDLHLQRLVSGAKALLIHSFDTDELTAQVQQAISAPDQVIKVLISRGQAGRGYSPQGIESPCCYISTAALPDYTNWQQQGIRLGVAGFKLAQQPALALGRGGGGRDRRAVPVAGPGRLAPRPAPLPRSVGRGAGNGGPRGGGPCRNPARSGGDGSGRPWRGGGLEWHRPRGNRPVPRRTGRPAD